MHIATKIFLILGTGVTLLGALFFALGINQANDIEESASQFALEEVMSGTIEVEDSDNIGDLGFTFWVKGTYEDLDENGYWDICNNTEITITSIPEILWQDENDSRTNGDFYNEVVHDYSGEDNSDCLSQDGNKNWDKKDLGLVKIGRGCLGCTNGNFSFTSNQSVWVTYDDKIIGDIIGDIFGTFAGFAGGTIVCCCGGLFLIIGGIMALTLKDNRQQDINYILPPSNQMISTFEDPPNGGE